MQSNPSPMIILSIALLVLIANSDSLLQEV